MTDTTQAFFERLAARGYEPLLHSISGTIRWAIEDTGRWFVVVNNGSLTVSRDTTGADCVLACSREDFDRTVRGKQNPITLFLPAKMKTTGHLGMAPTPQRPVPAESPSGPGT